MITIEHSTKTRFYCYVYDDYYLDRILNSLDRKGIWDYEFTGLNSVECEFEFENVKDATIFKMIVDIVNNNMLVLY